MKKEVADKWIEALESGKYRQGKAKLKNTIYAKECYCCLGVLCEISGLSKFEHGRYFNDAVYLPEEVVEWAGMKNRYGLIEGHDALTDMNDILEWSFQRIAAFLREHWEAL